jgi:hypothetical protein
VRQAQTPILPLHCTRKSHTVLHLFSAVLCIYNSCATKVPWYNAMATYIVERIKTGARIEKRLLKVLKALAEYRDMCLGDLLKGIVLRAFEGKSSFEEETMSGFANSRNFTGWTWAQLPVTNCADVSSASSEIRRKRR